MSTDTPAWLTSPGTAFSRQAAMERQIDVVAMRVAETFLKGVRAETEYRQPTAGFIGMSWLLVLSEQMARSSLEREAKNYVGAVLAESTFPDEVYASLTAVYSTEGHTDADIRRSLSLGTATSSLVASIAPTGMTWFDRIRRDVRTSATGLFGWTAQSAMQVTGVPYKRWVSRHDDRTRETHLEADGQTVRVNSPFIVGGTSLMHPGERGRAYEETVNCRCVMVGVLRGV